MPAGCAILGPHSASVDAFSLGPLADNGGPTLSVALQPSSAAIDDADPVQGCINADRLLTTSRRRAWPGRQRGGQLQAAREEPR
jgi:hypothetical protein